MRTSDCSRTWTALRSIFGKRWSSWLRPAYVVQLAGGRSRRRSLTTTRARVRVRACARQQTLAESLTPLRRQVDDAEALGAWYGFASGLGIHNPAFSSWRACRRSRYRAYEDAYDNMLLELARRQTQVQRLEILAANFARSVDAIAACTRRAAIATPRPALTRQGARGRARADSGRG